MAIVYDGPVLPDDLTVFVRQVPLPNMIWLQNVLPDRHLQTNRVDVGLLTRTGRTARFRAYDSQVHRSQRDAATLTTVKLPPLSDSLSMGELERLQIEFARTGGTNQAAFIDAIYNDAQVLTENVQRRMELARGDVLTDGKFTLAGEGGLTMEADYGVPSGRFVTSSVSWDDVTNADPINDMTGWIQAYRQDENGNGYNPGGMILPINLLLNLQRNANLRNQYATLVGAPSLLSRDNVNAILSTYGLPPILDVYDSQVDVDGVSTRVTDDDKVMFVPPDPGTNLGYTAWGLSATSLELVSDTRAELTFEEAPGVVGIVDKADAPPFRQTTFVDAVGMPVIENPRALMVATVVTDAS